MGGNEKTLGQRVRILGNRAKHTWETQVLLLSLFSAGVRLVFAAPARQRERSSDHEDLGLW
jgi:hypothetical protein